MLIDGGGSNDETAVDPADVGRKTVIPYLRYRGIGRIDVVVLTHPHSDHVGGLVAVLKDERVDAVLDGTVLPYDTPPYEAFLKEIASDHIPYRHAVRGTHLDFGDGVTGDVLNPPAIGTPYGTETDNATVNNYSTVIRLSYGKTHVILDGDAEEQAEDNMLASADDVSADVLKCGHHGAANATSNTWLDRVRPRYAAISCGLHNSFGHPSPQTIDRLRAHGIVPTVTATAGAAVYVSDGVQVVEEKTP